MVKINVDDIEIDELIHLNHKVCAGISQLRRITLYEKLKDFQIGEKVIFKNKEGNTFTGTVIRINQKTLTVMTQDSYWYCSPMAVQKFKPDAHLQDTHLQNT